MRSESREAPGPFSILGPAHLFHLAVPELYPLEYASDLVSKCLSSVSHSSKLLEPEEVAGQSQAQGTTWAYHWHLKGRCSCGTEPFTCGA